MKWRNQLLALLCLVAFGAFGVFYFRSWVVQKPFAIILFVGEGLTPQRLASTRLYRGGEAGLAIDDLEYSARLRNGSTDFAVPDAAAAATALATGLKVKNGVVAQKEDGSPAATILEYAHSTGRATGVVTDGSLGNVTAAAFFAHGNPDDFNRALRVSQSVDLAFGGGKEADLGHGDFRLIRKLAEMDEISVWQRSRIVGLFAEGDFPSSDNATARADKPSLADMVRGAITFLQQNRRGYVLVVDAHLMGMAAAQNAGERTLRETIELDHAVEVAREYAGENAAIAVTGDVAIGGMNISGFPYRQDSGAAILGLNSSGQPWITWATGPNAPGAPGGNQSEAEPAAVPASSALNTLEDPVISATGLRMERVRGTIDSTNVYFILRDAM